ncbi:hypothetical protein HK102_012133, partial [Quaeritorhiza haematococci]
MRAARNNGGGAARGGGGSGGSGKWFADYATKLRMSVTSGPDGATESFTLLEWLLKLVERGEDEQIKEHLPRLKYVLKQFESGTIACGEEGREAPHIIGEWRRRLKAERGIIDGPAAGGGAGAEEAGGEGMTEYEKKKMAAKKRKEQLMAQMAMAQKSFMANFGEELESLEDEGATAPGGVAGSKEFEGEGGDEMEDVEGFEGGVGTPKGKAKYAQPEERSWAFPKGTCIVCQEETKENGALFGMLGFIQPSNMLRQVNFNDVESVVGVLANPASLDCDQDR